MEIVLAAPEAGMRVGPAFTTPSIQKDTYALERVTAMHCHLLNCRPTVYGLQRMVPLTMM